MATETHYCATEEAAKAVEADFLKRWSHVYFPKVRIHKVPEYMGDQWQVFCERADSTGD